MPPRHAGERARQDDRKRDGNGSELAVPVPSQRRRKVVGLALPGPVDRMRGCMDVAPDFPHLVRH